MEEEKYENYKLQYFLEKCGLKNKYQMVSLIIIFLIYGTSEFLAIALPLLEINPYVTYLDTDLNKNFTIQADYKNCNSTLKRFKFEIVKEKSKSSLVTDFKIFCDGDKVSFIGSSLFLGVMLGSFISYFFSDKIGRKKTIILFSLLYSALQFLYLLNDNLYVLYSMLMLSGLFYSIIVLSSILLLNEVIDNELTAIFTTIIYNAYPVFGILYDVLFIKLDNWRLIFCIIGVIHFVSTIILALFLEESPRFHFGNKDLDSLQKTLSKIASVNKKEFDVVEIENIFNYNKSLIENSHDKKMNTRSQIGNDLDEPKTLLEKKIDNENINNKKTVDDYMTFQKPRISDECEKPTNEILKVEEAVKNLPGESLLSVGYSQKAKENSVPKSEKVPASYKRSITFNPELINTLIKNGEKATIKRKTFIDKSREIHDYTIMDLFRFKSQRGNFLIISFIWITSAVIFYALTIRLKAFSNEIYTNLFYIYSIDIVTCCFFGYLSNTIFFGRIKTMQLLMIISFVVFFMCLIIESTESRLQNYIILISRICFNSIFCIIYFISTEIYPTVVRAKGLAYNSAFSRLGGLLAPFIVEKMEDTVKFKLFCFLNFLSSILTFYLPETVGKPLEEKIPEEICEEEG